MATIFEVSSSITSRERVSGAPPPPQQRRAQRSRSIQTCSRLGLHFRRPPSAFRYRLALLPASTLTVTLALGRGLGLGLSIAALRFVMARLKTVPICGHLRPPLSGFGDTSPVPTPPPYGRLGGLRVPCSGDDDPPPRALSTGLSRRCLDGNQF